MKKIFITGIFLLISHLAQSQFHIETGLNFNLPVNDFNKNDKTGAGFYLEPKYAISDKVDLGLYFGVNGFANLSEGPYVGEIDAAIVIPILSTYTYRILSNRFTPYVGVGLGVYSARIFNVFGAGTDDSNRTQENVSEFGFAPRAGVYIGRMNLGVIYNSSKSIEFFQFNLGVRILDRK